MKHTCKIRNYLKICQQSVHVVYEDVVLNTENSLLRYNFDIKMNLLIIRIEALRFNM